jgi:putative FmdB family regulatory protein
MPTYEYKCPQCGTEFEAVQKMTAKPGAKCPACGGKAERQLSASGFVFKGSGFYLTDYGRAGQKSRSDAHERGGEKPAAEKPAIDKPAADKPAADKPEKSPAPAKPKKKDH